MKPKKMRKRDVTVPILKTVAKELNELMGLDPPIALNLKKPELIEKCIKASGLLEPTDVITSETAMALMALDVELPNADEPDEPVTVDDTPDEPDPDEPTEMGDPPDKDVGDTEPPPDPTPDPAEKKPPKPKPKAKTKPKAKAKGKTKTKPKAKAKPKATAKSNAAKVTRFQSVAVALAENQELNVESKDLGTASDAIFSKSGGTSSKRWGDWHARAFKAVVLAMHENGLSIEDVIE